MVSELAEQLQRYIDNTVLIRDLSSPQIEEIKNPEDYRLILLENFRRIGTLALENNRIMQTVFFPLLEKEEVLTEKEADALSEFRNAQINAYSMNNLDLPLVFRQTKKELRDAERIRDDGRMIDALDRMVEICFALMHLTERVVTVSNTCHTYRDEGIEAGDKLLAYLAKPAFVKLSPAKKAVVLVNARYMSALFERGDCVGDEAVNEADLQFLYRALALADDPFYVEEAPEYDWRYHKFRTLQYIAQMTFNGNDRRLTRAQCEAVCDCAKRLMELWYEEHAALMKYSSDAMMELIYSRDLYFAGRTDAETYRSALVGLYENIDDKNYSFHNSSRMTLVPMELMALVRSGAIPLLDTEKIGKYYERMIAYLHRMPKKGSFSFLLTYLATILETFVGVPGGMDFETFCLRLTAALHPPTYVHVKSVAAFSVCIAKHLIRKNPACFIGFMDCATEADVQRKEQKILDFVNHAALCHDIGKLFVTEVIMTYGRTLLDEEFELIKTHPEIGAVMLKAHEETEVYANVALMHHKWFNDKGGYPMHHSFVGMADKVVISVVTVADCLDASTDAVGRSYKRGKSLEDYIEELHRDSGTRYAPYLAALLEEDEVRQDLQRILTEGRAENYREAYRILASYHVKK